MQRVFTEICGKPACPEAETGRLQGQYRHSRQFFGGRDAEFALRDTTSVPLVEALAMGGPGIGAWLAIQALLALLGMLLLIRGLRPRRVGDTRYCRGCGYNLRGTDSPRCNECGADITARGAVLIGERIVRRGRVAMGSLLLLVGLAGGVGVTIAHYRSFDFYTLKPTAWVVRDALRGNAALSARALKELRVRVAGNADALSDGQVAEVADFCLTEQARQTETPLVGDAAIELLGGLFAIDRLTGDRRTKFLENLQYLEFHARPRIYLGNELPIKMMIAGRSPIAGPGYTGRGVSVRVNGTQVRNQFGRWQGSGSNSSGSSSGGLDALPSGTHRIECDVELTAVRRPAVAGGSSIGAELPADSDSQPILRYVKTFACEVEVLASRGIEVIQRDSRPETDAAVRRSLKPATFRLSRSGWLSGNIEMIGDSLPAAIAVDAFVEYAGKSLKLDRALIIPAGQKTTRVLSLRLTDAPERIAIVLRSSIEAAAREVGIDSIWDGEIRFDDVTVEHVGGPREGMPADDPNAPG